MDEKKRPLKEAVALEYNIEQAAPKVVAAGRGESAERIVAKAEELKIPVHADADLAHTLNALQIGQEIPAELYTVVAQVLLYVRNLDKKN
ncbi:flagellar biosynthetic protein FlhB [Clostridia bacterium]|nr:flagellar biosynthetic protein FlhB [Clostridia bacterium]